ncbi:M14 family metallopeptidase [Puia dinghuensis]|uniref:Peptidase n=1 Tax=Puia dinghuensis TaxID=1792502 RepID=A0A8J2XVQ8_9BACT|nr:M14 metallopeptidase family protein [Puia dinghuensis]GGB17552.1 peptidase [Puia dinghuensis]
MRLAALLLLLLGFTTAQSQQPDASIPTPKSHFGFTIGDNYQLATYTQTEAYFQKIAAASPRAKFTIIGKTEEGRDQFMLLVSSPENIKNLDHYKAISQQLAHAENLTDEQARALAAEGKAIVWIDGGLHANEVVGAHQLIETAYQLLSRTDPETVNILDKVIILLTHANPDGQQLVSNWYMRKPSPESRSLDALPRLYEKYAGHDNNRDFYMLNLKETQNIARQLFVEWLPQIMYNHHQAGPTGTILAGPPYRDPFNYVFDPLVITSLDAVGAAMVNRLNAEGKPGYTERTGSSYSTWYNGGLRTTTYFHNIIGLLTEIIGSPTPSDVPLVPNRLIPNGSTPFPVTPQKWYFRQSIDYSISLNYAVLDYAMRYRDELLYNIYRMGRNSIEKGQKDYWTLSPKRVDAINQLYTASNHRRNDSATGATGNAINLGGGRGDTIPARFYDSILKNPALRDPRGYIIPSNQPDFPTATRFINALIGTGIAISKATAPFTVKGITYPAGSYIVKTDQAFRPHVLDMFEPQDHPNDFAYPGGPPIAPYDAAGWTLAYTMGIKFDRFPDGFDGPFERIPYGQLQSATPPSPKEGWLDARSNAAYTIVNDNLKAKKPIYRNTTNGNFYVGGSHQPRNAVKLTPTRIALWDTYGGSMPSGWARYILEQYHFPFDVIYSATVDSGHLKEKYDVIIFVSGAIPALAGEGGGGRGGFRIEQPKPDSIPAEYRSLLGRITAQKSIPQLKEFLQAGGHIVTIGSSANLAYQLGLPVHDALVEMTGGKERRLSNDKFYIPGSVMQVTLDTTSQPAWGMAAEADVYFEESPVFHINPEATANGSVRPIAWFASDKTLRSGWAWGQAYLRDGVAAFEANIGKGKLYVFGPEITFRAQTHGTFKLLFNQLYSYH